MTKRFCIIIILVVGGFLIIDGLFLAITTNLNTGTSLTILAGAILTAWGIWYERIAQITKKGFLRIIKYAVISIMILEMVLIVFLACQGQDASVNYDEDAVVVLGAAVHGTQVSQSLSYRLDSAIEYAEKNPKAVIVVSGGKGPQETITEALAMENYLTDKGIAQERILKEERATSTSENFKLSKEILNRRLGSTYTCVYITNRYHLYRAGNIAKLLGMEAVGLGAATDWYYLPAAYLRESLAVIKLWIFKS